MDVGVTVGVGSWGSILHALISSSESNVAIMAILILDILGITFLNGISPSLASGGEERLRCLRLGMTYS